ATTPTSTVRSLSLHDALPICAAPECVAVISASDGPEKFDGELIALAGALRNKYQEDMDAFAPHKALEEVFAVIQRANKYIDENRSEEHTSELQSRFDLVCRLL